MKNLSRIVLIDSFSEEKAEYLGYVLASIVLNVWSESTKAEVDKALSRTWKGHHMVMVGLVSFMESSLESSDVPARNVVLCFQNVLLRTIAGPTCTWKQ
jgi:hypothetical protein